MLFNAILRTGYFPSRRKRLESDSNNYDSKTWLRSYQCRSISSLLIISKLFQKLFLQKLMPVMAEKRIINQFGFCSKYATVEQIYRITNKITLVFETGKYFSAMFLDVSRQTFDKIWHNSLLFRIQQHSPKKCHVILKGYLKKYFFIK